MDWQFFSEIIGLLLSFGIGLGCGSYATMPYYRLPTGEACAGKWIGKKSHCTTCNHQLRTRDLVPVFNWLLTRGKCQFCNTEINPVYFVIELSITIVSVLTFAKFGFENINLYIMVLGLGTCLVILSATEFTYRTFPNPLLVVAVMFGFLYSSPEQFYDVINVFVMAVLFGLAYSKLYERFTKKKFTAYKYLKLIAVAGFWMKLQDFVMFLVITGLLCLILQVLTGKFENDNSSDDSKKQTPAFGIVISIVFISMVLFS